MDDKLQAIQQYVKTLFAHDASGHDFFHMRRVAYLAKQIAIEEGGDSFICEASGWLHDVGDRKLFQNPQESLKQLDVFLKTIGLTEIEINNIKIAMQDVSFSKGNKPQSLEGEIVQDADRLDAIGAIGIARAFAYGGENGKLIYHETDKEQTSIQHFYQKLLTLKDTLNTRPAKIIAHERHLFMQKFLDQFFHEWR